MLWFAGLLGLFFAASLADALLNSDTGDDGAEAEGEAGGTASLAEDPRGSLADLLDELPGWPEDQQPPDAAEPSPWDHLLHDPWAAPDTPDEPLPPDGPDSTDDPPPPPAAGDFLRAADDAGAVLTGGDGADTLFGGAGDDLIHGGAGNDLMVAGLGDNRLWGGDGDDRLIGGPGADTLDGGPGNDTLLAGGGAALLRGGAGDDLLLGGDGDTTLEGGAGNDTLLAGGGNNMLAGGFGDDLLIAGPGADTLFGGAGNDTLVGVRFDADGNDRAGPSLLNGGAGDDLLILGRDDTAHGGSGADSFLLGDWMAGGGAVIADFDPAEDRLLVGYDPGLYPAPVVSLAAVADDPGAAVVLLDGQALAVVRGGAGLDPQAITLVPGWPPQFG